MPPTLVFPALGLLLAALGWPMATRRVPPNRWYGLRVPATFADEQATPLPAGIWSSWEPWSEWSG